MSDTIGELFCCWYFGDVDCSEKVKNYYAMVYDEPRQCCNKDYWFGPGNKRNEPITFIAVQY